MKAVVTVIGKDKVGIIAKTSAECAAHGVNILDITQTVMKEYFSMIMLCDLGGMETEFRAFSDALSALGVREGVEIRVMHEDIFNSMHKI